MASHLTFFTALSGSASIFIGIITALLINKISDISNEKDTLNSRKEKLAAKIESLENEKQAHKQDKEREETIWAEEDAESNILEFQEYLRNLEPNFDSVDQDTLESLLDDFLEDSEANEFHLKLLEEKEEELKDSLMGNPPKGVFETLVPDMSDIQQMRQRNKIQERQELNEAERNIARIRREEEILLREKSRLEAKLENLSPWKLHISLLINFLAILFAVVVPIGLYFNANLSVVVLSETQAVKTAFISWLIGLLLVFVHIFVNIFSVQRG